MFDWISVQDAARKLGISERQVRNWIRQGKLQADKNGGMWHIYNFSEAVNGNSETVGGNGDRLRATSEDSGSAEVEFLRRQITSLQKQNERLLEQNEELLRQLDDSKQRSDTIILKLTDQIEQRTLLLEDLRTKPRWWQFWKRRVNGLKNNWEKS